ncbi:hypothetical protein SAMN02745161_1647 [Halodesulfovibrio marinisediminis DSM 17456]|uniref:DUF2065 domain-containing protein n=2 Tax=Halodesulfovibrio marinisediminis TaxID=458711 RepID=A0A1N6GJZ6_9BACT|nr:hypothetical protein SAMN02745161_1647 [Halodesulfovibrio marinisediminis DSM 17456]
MYEKTGSMQIDWNLLLTALGLAFVLEGLPYVLFADKLPKYLREIAERGPNALRYMGLTAMSVGVLLVWLMRH